MKKPFKPKEETGPFRRAEHFASLRETLDDTRESTRRLQVRAVRRAGRFVGAAPVSGASNWLPLGPALVKDGQAATLPPVSGRLTTLQILETGTVFVGAANGGVWRSDDRGHSWTPLMDGVTRQSAGTRADTLAVGALAVPRQDPRRVYVGTGEGGMGGDGFFGVGPLRSDDGGRTWLQETWPGGESAFYQLAVDPQDPERVLGAATSGLFLRQPRNQDAPGLPFPRPTSYRYRYDATTGEIRAQYWAEDGRNAIDAPTRAGTWAPDLYLRPIQLDSSPWLLVYRQNGAHPYVGMPAGAVQLVPVPADGGLPRLGAITAWAPDLTVFDFALDGEHYLCRYDGTADPGVANLERLTQPWDGTFAPAGAPMNWGRWRQVVTLVLGGSPYLLFYGDVTNGVGRRAVLRRWAADLTLVDVWQADDRFADGRTLVPFVFKSEQLLLQYDPTTGDIQVFRFRFDGEPIQIWRRAGRMPRQASLVPFHFLDRRDGGYRDQSLILASRADGAVELFDWAARLRSIWKQQAEPGKTYVPFDIGHAWENIRPRLTPHPVQGPVTSVTISTSGSTTRYHAAVQIQPGQGWSIVYASDDHGRTWSQVGQLMVSGRVTLAAQTGNADIIYAFAQDSTLHRLDHRDPRGWRPVQGMPANNVLATSQGWYDLAIAVSPEDPDTVFVGGAAVFAASSYWRDWSAAIYRCTIREQDGALLASPTYLGASVHADVHGFAFTPGDPNELWVACDGGLFVTEDAHRSGSGRTVDLFASRNAGLATMTVNRSMRWGEEDAVGFSSNQDNGLQIYQGGMLWQMTARGDSGASVRNGDDVLMTFDSYKLGFSNQRGRPNTIQASDQLQRVVTFLGDIGSFYPPLVVRTGTNDVLTGTVRPWVSNDLGRTWSVIPTVGPPAAAAPAVPYPAAAPFPPRPGLENTQENKITAMVWTNANRFYVGTIGGQVRRYDLAAGQWSATTWRLPGPADRRPITSLTMGGDADTVLLTVGGGVGPRVYRLGTAAPPGVWTARMGVPPQVLPDIPMHTLVHGTANELFVGGELGVWHSQDDGGHWVPFSQGLPESAVLDLQYFGALAGPRTRPALLRASTHGRGVWDRAVRDRAPDVQLLLRVNPLDTGLENRRNAPDPLNAAVQYSVRDGACIKPTNPTAEGRWPLPAVIPWQDFHTRAVDESRRLVHDRPVRLYLELHDRGVLATDSAYLSIFVSHAYDPLPAVLPPDVMAWPAPPQLPNAYATLVEHQTLNRDARYDLLHFVQVPEVHAERPQVVSVDLPASAFPGAGYYCIVVIASCTQAPFFDGQRNVDTLVTTNFGVASKFLAVH